MPLALTTCIPQVIWNLPVCCGVKASVILLSPGLSSTAIPRALIVKVRNLFYNPRHPYTRALLDSIPKLGSKAALYAIPGQPPDLSALPAGCSFHPRCPSAMPHCADKEPELIEIAPGHQVACHLY